MFVRHNFPHLSCPFPLTRHASCCSLFRIMEGVMQTTAHSSTMHGRALRRHEHMRHVRRAVKWIDISSDPGTRRQADTHTHTLRRMGGRRKSRMSVIDIDAGVVSQSQEFPGPLAQCVYWCCRGWGTGAGKETRGEGSRSYPHFSSFPCFHEGCETLRHHTLLPSQSGLQSTPCLVRRRAAMVETH